MPPHLFVATKALVRFNGKILVLRESFQYRVGTNPNKFDVVGGRLEPGEKWEESLLREVKEETGLSVKIGKPFHVGEWRPIVKGESWQIIGIFFACDADSDNVKLSEDHDHYKWIHPENYSKEDLIPNLLPVFKNYLDK